MAGHEHERRDVDVGLTVRVLLGLLVTVGVGMAAVAGLLAWLGAVPRPPAQPPDQAADFPAPRLRVEPLAEPEALAREKAPKLAHVDETMRRLEMSGWPPEERRP